MSSQPRSQRRGQRPAARRAKLSRNRLAAAALALIDRDGLEACSTRKLGAALGVEAMAIYHHFPSKERLLDAVAERLLAEMALPPPDGDWIGWLRGAAHAYRAIAKRHPNAFVLLAMRRFTTPSLFALLETWFGVLRRAGFDPATTARIFRTIGYFTNGAGLADVATRAAADDPQRRTPLDDFRDDVSLPHVAAVAPHLRQGALDGIFSFGLELLLADFARLPKAAPPAPRRRKPRESHP